MAGIIPSSIFPDVAFPEDLLLFMKRLHDEKMRIGWKRLEGNERMMRIHQSIPRPAMWLELEFWADEMGAEK